ncbi:MAG: VOC family protein [Gemmatimonas sp.]|jgi:hypothetical protein
MILETFVRVFVASEALDPTVAFYKALLQGEETLRFDYPEAGLRLASVSSPHLSVLVIAGPPEKRKPFEATRLTIKVSRLEEYAALLQSQGAELLDPIQRTPVGRKMRYRHADRLIVEYVEHGS